MRASSGIGSTGADKAEGSAAGTGIVGSTAGGIVGRIDGPWIAAAAIGHSPGWCT